MPAKLQAGGHQVIVLARNQRLTDIRQRGLVLENVVSTARSTTWTETTDRFARGDHYDLVVIAVRRDQLAGWWPELAANERVPAFLFMLNNPIGSADLAARLHQLKCMRLPVPAIPTPVNAGCQTCDTDTTR